MRIHVHMFTYIYINKHTYHTYKHTPWPSSNICRADIHTAVRKYTYINMYTYTYTYMDTHIYTYTYIQI